MVSNGTLLGVSEFLKLCIPSGQSLARIETVSVLLGIRLQVIVRECLAAFASLLLADVIQVGVAKEAHSTEKESQVALTVVIERVGLVPVWELASVLVRQRCFVSHFHVTVDSKQMELGHSLTITYSFWLTGMWLYALLAPLPECGYIKVKPPFLLAWL